jgi:hypothetical protein
MTQPQVQTVLYDTLHWPPDSPRYHMPAKGSHRTCPHLKS